MAGVMAQCGGLGCMLNRLTGIKDFKQGRHLLTVSACFRHSPKFPGILLWFIESESENQPRGVCEGVVL